MTRYLVGIDVGTSAVKAVVLSERGEMVWNHRSDLLRRSHEADRSQQDPAEWVEAIHECLRGVVEFGGSIDAIGLCFNCSTLVPSSVKDFAPAGPAILWNDTSSHDEAMSLETALLRRGVHRRIPAGEPAARYLYFASSYGADSRGAVCFPEAATWIIHRLTGRRALPEAIFIGRWGVLADAGARTVVFDEFPPTKRLFDGSIAPLLRSYDEAGTLMSPLGSEFRPIDGTPVYSSGNDGLTALFGTGFISDGRVDFLMCGTSKLYLASLEGRSAQLDLDAFELIGNLEPLFGRSYALFELGDTVEYAACERVFSTGAVSERTLCVVGGGSADGEFHPNHQGRVVVCGPFAGAAGTAALAGMGARILPRDAASVSSMLRQNWKEGYVR